MNAKHIEEACRSACELIGVNYKSVPSDGVFHLADLTDDHRGKGDGRIKIFQDRQGGIVWNHKSGAQRTFFINSKPGEPVSPAELERIKREQQRRQVELEKSQDKATCRARTIWQTAKPAPVNHPYLTRKRIKPHGARIGVWQRTIKDDSGKPHKLTINGALLLPMIDKTGVIRSLQAIFPEKSPDLDRDRDFLPGGCLAGLFWWIGAKTDKLLIAEGFATAASLHEESGYRVYLAFTANNLLAVGQIIREKLPDADLVFCADNDTKTKGNPGVTKATEAAQAVTGSVAVPPIQGDFNDYALFLREPA